MDFYEKQKAFFIFKLRSNRVVFVPLSDYQPEFTVTLLEQGSEAKKVLNVVVRA